MRLCDVDELLSFLASAFLGSRFYVGWRAFVVSGKAAVVVSAKSQSPSVPFFKGGGQRRLLLRGMLDPLKKIRNPRITMAFQPRPV